MGAEFWTELYKNLAELEIRIINWNELNEKTSEKMKLDSRGEPTILLYSGDDYAIMRYGISVAPGVISLIKQRCLRGILRLEGRVFEKQDGKFDRIYNILKSYISAEQNFKVEGISWAESPEKAKDKKYLVPLVLAIEKANKTSPYGRNEYHPITLLEQKYSFSSQPQVNIVREQDKPLELEVIYNLINPLK